MDWQRCLAEVSGIYLSPWVALTFLRALGLGYLLGTFFKDTSWTSKLMCRIYQDQRVRNFNVRRRQMSNAPAVGNSFWRMTHRQILPRIEARDAQFYQHIVKNRVDPSRQTATYVLLAFRPTVSHEFAFVAILYPTFTVGDVPLQIIPLSSFDS